MPVQNPILPKYHIGDVVQLNSGGPLMTVKILVYTIDRRTAKYDIYTGRVICQWFEDRLIDDTPHLAEAEFHQDTVTQ